MNEQSTNDEPAAVVGSVRSKKRLKIQNCTDDDDDDDETRERSPQDDDDDDDEEEEEEEYDDDDDDVQCEKRSELIRVERKIIRLN
ncbi:hypothetical protein L195_g052349 [Trifolium pratense]|uniref:Uncharacterized protein n=1 Tax=Trifolium pratense TaxID=57577 RepID=A0A2K3K4P4_TRIPR|nr:hypothetical protein L195_g052349 [Trifolium pratense]